jgi:predicted  nucleic acid-binding Zn-ribbon protein
MWACLGCGYRTRNIPERCPKCGCPFFQRVKEEEAEGK